MENEKKFDKYGFYLDEISKERSIHGTFDIVLFYTDLTIENSAFFIIPFKKHGLLKDIRKYKEIEQGIKDKNILEAFAYLINNTDYINMSIFKQQASNIPPCLLVNNDAINEFIKLIASSHPEYVCKLKQHIMNDRKYLIEKTNYLQNQKYLEELRNSRRENLNKFM